MNIRILIISILFLSVTKANAVTVKNDSVPYCAVIKLSLFTPLELYPAIQLGFEHSFKKRFSAAHEIGFIADEFSAWRVIQPQIRVDRIGVRYRFTPRFYFQDIEPHGFNFFLGPEVMYKYVLLRRTDEYCRYGCAYLQTIEVKQHRHVLGLGVKTGFWNGFPKTGLVIEFEFGIGGKLLFRDDNIPVDAEINQFERIGMFGDFFRLDQKGPKAKFLFNSVISFKLGWGIPKKYRNSVSAPENR
jgi:hypothetical protein